MIAVMEKSDKQELLEAIGIMGQTIHIEMNQKFGVLIEYMDDKFALIAERFDGIDFRLDRLENTVAIHTEMIGRLVMDIEILRDDKADKKDLLALEGRVERLE